MNHERKVAFTQRRKRKLNADAALFVTRPRVASLVQRSLDKGFHIRSHLGLTISTPRYFHFKGDLPR